MRTYSNNFTSKDYFGDKDMKIKISLPSCQLIRVTYLGLSINDLGGGENIGHKFFEMRVLSGHTSSKKFDLGRSS